MATPRRPQRSKPQADVIEMLEQMLNDARVGYLQDVLVVWVDDSGEGGYSYRASNVEALVFEGRVATGEIRTRTSKRRTRTQ